MILLRDVRECFGSVIEGMFWFCCRGEVLVLLSWQCFGSVVVFLLRESTRNMHMLRSKSGAAAREYVRMLSFELSRDQQRR